jgi:hypothetical protein
MMSSTIGLVAASLMILVALRLLSGQGRIVGALVGMMVGFLIGIVVNVAVGFMHWFGPVDIPNPVIQIGGVATTIGTLYPVMFGAVGFIVGLVLGWSGKQCQNDDGMRDEAG